MKLFVCSSVETSDDDEEEAVSEEEPQADSDEDEDEADAGESNAEENVSDKIDDENGSGAKRKRNKISGNSAASSSSDTETSFKDVNGKQKKNDVKEEQPVKGPELNVSKFSNKTKSVVNGIRLPARIKNVSTEIMVLAAIRSLNERGGSSAIAIKKYIMNNYPQLDEPRTMKLIKNFIKKALVSGKLVQSKGTGLGGSFKVSPATIRLEEQNRKRAVKKLKSDQVQSADKVKKNSKATTKKFQKGDIKSATDVKNTKAKVSKSAVKVKDESDSATKMPKISATVKNTLQASVPKPVKKAAKTKDAKEASLASGNPVKKTKVDSSIKKSYKMTSADVETVEEKGKGATSTKKKAPEGKTTMTNIEMGAGDANDTKPIKKTAGKKVKAK